MSLKVCVYKVTPRGRRQCRCPFTLITWTSSTRSMSHDLPRHTDSPWSLKYFCQICCSLVDRFLRYGQVPNAILYHWTAPTHSHLPPSGGGSRPHRPAGGDEWLTAGDVTTYHERRSVTGGPWWRVLLKLHCQQVTLMYRGNDCRSA